MRGRVCPETICLHLEHTYRGRQGSGLGRRLPAFSILLGLASLAALEGTDEPIWTTREGPATLNTIALGARVLFTIGRSTLGVHAFSVPLPPVPDPFPSAFSAPALATVLSPSVGAELLRLKRPLTVGASDHFKLASQEAPACEKLAAGSFGDISRWMPPALPSLHCTICTALARREV
jgi:hypothetical protein